MTESSGPANHLEPNSRVVHANRKLKYLSDISELLAASLDLDVTIKTVSKLTVPYLADWCIVARADRRATNERPMMWTIVAASHADPSKEGLTERVARAAVVEASRSGSLLARVMADIESGQPVVLRATNEESLQALAPDEVFRRSVLALGVATIAVVPLRSRSGTIGAIVVGSADPSRPMEALDLALVEDVGRRAALAIENSTLYREAQDALRQRDALLSIVSHDLRNSLVLIGGYAQVIQREIPPFFPNRERVESQLKLITSSAALMGTQLDELIDLPMLAAGSKIQLNLQTVDLVALTRQVIALYATTTSQHQIQLDVGAEPIEGHWDPARLQRVIANLLSNAIKYSPRGGPVRVSIAARKTRKRSEVVLTVTDEGVGIPAADLSHVFEMFHRASNVRTGFRGTGLGLPSVRAIVEQHGGRVGVTSVEGAGSTFFVRLPRR